MKSREKITCPRPARRINKIVIFERRHRVIKMILDKLQDDKCYTSIPVNISRAVYFSNIISVSSVLSSFELARGYAPAIMGNARQFVTQDILTAHEERVATRTMQRLMTAKNNNPINNDRLLKGLPVLFLPLPQDELKRRVEIGAYR